MNYKKNFTKCLLVFSLLMFSIPKSVLASETVGTITHAKGNFEVLIPVSDNEKADGTVRFNEKTYKVIKGKLGLVLKNEYIINTVDAKVRIIFANGDQFMVGPGTSYQLKWSEGKKEQGNVLNIMYGKVRGVISQEGPRTGLKINTRGAVAGVRGTDFAVHAVGSQTDFSVLRGKVELAAASSPTQAVAISAGQTAVLKVADNKTQDPLKALEEQTKAIETAQNKNVQTKTEDIKIIDTSKEKLIQIQNASKVEVNKEIVASLPTNLQKDLVVLEEKAKENSLKEIKKYDPAQYEQIKKEAPKSVDELNTAVVSKLYVEAPAEKPKQKASKKDFEDIDEDVYNKYFKINN